MSKLVIYSAIAGAQAVKTVTQRIITRKWNQTTKQTAKERTVCVEQECLTAPDVPEAFRALVESALAESAVETLKAFCDDNPLSTEVDAHLFTRPQLIESFLQRGVNLSKSELDEAFTKSATWQRIAGNELFKSGDDGYIARANYFKETILKLSGKNTAPLSLTRAQQFLTKIEDEDMSTPFGMFVTRKLQAMIREAQKAVIEHDLSDL